MWLIITILLILLIIILIMMYQQQINEGFLSGTDVQLLTSKPYYTWYDYLTNIRKYPYGMYYYQPYVPSERTFRSYNPIYSYFGKPYPTYFHKPFYRPHYY